MKKLMLLFFITAMIVFALPHTNMAAGNVQSMIDSLEDGAVLQLEDKTYEGNIVIDKPMTLIGSSKTVIKGDGTGNVISVRAPGVTVKNLTVTHGSMNRNTAEEFAAVKVYTNNNVIDGLTITDSFHGVYLSQAHHNLVQNVTVTGLGKGIIAEQGNGLHIYYANNNTLKNNTIKGTRDGMFFDHADGNISENNYISETRYGLHYMYSNKNTFKHNTFTFNTGGAAIMNSNELELSENQFIFNYGHKSFGLLLLSSNDSRVENNLFFLNQRGLYIDQATRDHYKNNQIIKNQIGVELWASSNDQIFTLNQIEENTIPVATLGGQGRNSWHLNEKGNQWGSTFPLTDLDANGIGDQPITYYSSLNKLMEEQELTYLFLKSPAIGIYEKMNELFNNEEAIFKDPYPLVSVSKGTQNWVWLTFTIAIAAFILLKGRHVLCSIFGRNGRRT